MRPPLGRLVVLAHEHFFECLPKHFVENRIKYGVHHRAGVAQPGDHVNHPRRHVLLAAVAQRRQQIQHEKRRPQDDEREKHDAQHLGGLLLQPNDAAVARRIARDHTGVARMVRPDGGGALQQTRRGRCLNRLVVEQRVVAVDDVVVVAQRGRATQRRHGHLLRFGGRQQERCASAAAETRAAALATLCVPRDDRVGFRVAQFADGRRRGNDLQDRFGGRQAG